jgi:hypothetical protein
MRAFQQASEWQLLAVLLEENDATLQSFWL